jgi:hypothetical protein
MNRPFLAPALALVMASCAWLTHASAAPPTVTPSPGYDARLQEERAARNAASQPTATGGGSGTGPVIGRHVKKTHHPLH